MMLEEEAIQLIAGAINNGKAAQIWADLGCGTGTFTMALGSLLPAGSIIHAIDRQSQNLPQQFGNACIHFHRADFEKDTLPFNDADGILLANALHYVKDQQSLLAQLTSRLRQEGRFLLIEYDRRQANRWVPYPLPLADAIHLFHSIGFNNFQKLNERPSIYGQGTMYSCMASREN
jgi:ubiquinone/menaquinone biosynthesis C-methylase UbiE